MNKLNYIRPDDITDADLVAIQPTLNYVDTVILARYYRGYTFKNDPVLLSVRNVLALSRKFNIDLITFTQDLYHRQLINHFLKHKSLSNYKCYLPFRLFNEYPFFKSLKCRSPVLFAAFQNILQISLQMFNFPEIAATLYSIDDDLCQYLEITFTINKLLKTSVCIIFLSLTELKLFFSI